MLRLKAVTPAPELRAAFLASAGSDAARWSAVPTLDDALARLWALACAALPTLPMTPGGFATHLARHAAPHCTNVDELAQLDGAALALAYACVERLPGADAEFFARHDRDINIALARSGLDQHAIDDVRQIVCSKLLGPEGRLSRYSGRGELGNWVRAVTVREALTWRRRQPTREIPVADPISLALPGSDPELSFIKAAYRDELTEALREAITALDPQDRALLRNRYTDGLTLEQLAAVHGVHRATAARWLATVREQLLRSIQRYLRDKLGLRPDEFASIVDFVRSRLDITLGVLMTHPPSR